jgi:Na+/H+ antiporter NhaD/arsenite permease-like protein
MFGIHNLALSLIAITYLGVAIGEYPRLRMNRATIALVGAIALVIVGVLPLEVALQSLDVDTLLLLFAMMIINVHLRLAGFFDFVSLRIVAWARSPRVLLLGIVGASGVLSALFLNDTIVLMFTPLVLQVTMRLKRNPIPYLIGLVTAANIGSTATIIGNPQNMLIGMSSRIPFVDFLLALAPVSIIGLVLAWGILVLVYRSEFTSEHFEKPEIVSAPIDKTLLYKSLGLSGLMLVAFVLGAPIPLAALAAAAGLLVTRRINPDEVLAQVDWSLLVFFSGLFVVTGAISYTHWSDVLFTMGEPIARAGVAPLSIVTVILSNLISNVPAVLLFRPLVPQFANPTRVWLTLAMASTLAGNLTLLGSVANLIVAESARARGVKLSFVEYLKAGVPITLLTLLVGIVWLSII